MKVAVDAMGGDKAPLEIVRGAVRAARREKAEIVLVGDEPQIRKVLDGMKLKKGSKVLAKISIHHTPEWIRMDEAGAHALKKKKQASIVVCCELLKRGEVDAIVSAGNTSGVIGASLLTLGRIQGIRRPALAVMFPTLTVPALLLDLGATVDCKPEFLVQFGTMGSIYVEKVLGRPKPRVGIVNIGEEHTKGNALVKEGYELFEKTSLNFVGSVEPKQLINGNVDVAVADGFVGNLMLKMGEAVGEWIMKTVRTRIGWNPVYLGAAAALTPVLKSLRKSLDHSEYGGAPLLGVSGVVIKSHGRAKSLTIRNAIRVAIKMAESGTIDVIASTLKSEADTAARVTTTLMLGWGSSVRSVRGVGPGLALHLDRLGITTLEDLVWHFPTGHEDRTRVMPIASLFDGQWAVICGDIRLVREKTPSRQLHILEATLMDATGQLQLTWFNQPHLKALLNGRLNVWGKVERKLGHFQITGADIEAVRDKPSALFGRLVPVYALTKGLTQKILRRIQVEALRAIPAVAEVVPDSLRHRYSLMPRRRAMLAMHYPKDNATLAAAQRTLAFEEFFIQQIGVRLKRQGRAVQPRLIQYLHTENFEDRYTGLLGFAPTGAQRRAFHDILTDLHSPHPMARLVQGDVGCGKTAVAAFAACCAVWNGGQAAVMAPTEILAEQHMVKLSALLAPAGIRVGLLTGSLRTRAKAAVKQAIAAGELHVVVGTHALIQEGVEFERLALVVVDEQHKFGVMQRTRLWEKGDAPDLLVMTATPIPRTLTLTTYGDLDCTIIDELPPGRTPIRTWWIHTGKQRDAYQWVREQVREGRQAYVVCPLIEESEKLELASAQQKFEELSQDIFPDLRLALLHGRMKADEKAAVMEQFRTGAFQVLVSTTVIEVGVDIPNATVMVIQDADRFGLAQLHQLRGRVGRGQERSYCILIADPESQGGRERMQCLVKSQDGFVVAEEDLRLRGPGDYYGTRQAGFMQLRVADMAIHRTELEQAREAAQAVLAGDPGLADPAWATLRVLVERAFPGSSQHFH